MKPIIIANWKCNPTSLAEAKKLFDLIKKGIEKACSRRSRRVEVVICPPFVYISDLKFKAHNLKSGTQDCFWENEGAFTGEISPLMLKNLGTEYVILGHSERRKHFNETNEIINKKIKKALEIKLKPILCIGETEKEKRNGEKILVIKEQIRKGLKGVSRKEINNIAIAYEPVWAIGTGENCSIDETMSSVLLIRKIISKIYNRVIAEKIRILYGGSVNSKNAEDYIKAAKTNGLLIGGASLNPDEFIQIIKNIQ